MAYDLHGAWDPKIGINAPLFEGPNDVTELQRHLNVNASIHYWLQQGWATELSATIARNKNLKILQVLRVRKSSWACLYMVEHSLCETPAKP